MNTIPVKHVISEGAVFILKNFYNHILDLIYPPKCIVCQDILNYGNKSWVCEVCEKFLEAIEKAVCIKCGIPVENENMMCGGCLKKSSVFINNYALFIYDNFIRRLIHNFKYAKYRENIRGIAYLLEKHLKLDKFDNIDFIVSVPLHKKRLKKRGFNQSELIAREVSRITGIPYLHNILVRNKNTKPQSLLSYQARLKNLDDAFSLGRSFNINSKNILVVDDIFTTGSTMNSCADVLLKNGAAEVYGFSFSISVKDS